MLGLCFSCKHLTKYLLTATQIKYVSLRISSKGISPLVAAVLLIAVTMTIAGMLAYWTSSFVRSGLPEQNQTQQIQRCAGADFTIFSSNYNSSTGNMTLILQNKAEVSLQITNVTFVYPNGTIDVKPVGTNLAKGSALISFIVSNIFSGFNNYLVLTDCPNVFIKV